VSEMEAQTDTSRAAPRTRSRKNVRSAAPPARSSTLRPDAAKMVEMWTRQVQAIVVEKPLVAVGGAFATGFVVGGGWRTRIGRFMMMAAFRYAAVEAAERYLGLV
jgi:hypothetical protein